MDEQPWSARLARLNGRLEGTGVLVEVQGEDNGTYRARLHVDSVAVQSAVPGAGEDGLGIVLTGTPAPISDQEVPRGRGRFAFSALLNLARLINNNLSALQRFLARGKSIPVRQLAGVTCLGCGHDRTGQFCPSCGTRLRFARTASCTEDHHEAERASHRFCSRCGAWLSSKPGSGKERLRGLGHGDFGGS